ncbi:Autophagy-related protein 13, partial [Orpheovirus IHUMI-LCC2]
LKSYYNYFKYVRYNMDKEEFTKFKEQNYHLIRESINKLSHIITEPKLSSKDTESTAKNNWLHMQTDDIVEITNAISSWTNNIFLPLRIRIYINYRHLSEPPTLLEEWKLSFQDSIVTPDDKRIQVATLNKRLASLVRSVYAYVRMLPSYSLTKNTKKNGDVYYFTYKFMTPEQSNSLPSFANNSPDSFNFLDIKSSFGTLTLSVKYIKNYRIPSSYTNIQKVIVDNYTPTVASHPNSKSPLSNLLNGETPKSISPISYTQTPPIANLLNSQTPKSISPISNLLNNQTPKSVSPISYSQSPKHPGSYKATGNPYGLGISPFRTSILSSLAQSSNSIPSHPIIHKYDKDDVPEFELDDIPPFDLSLGSLNNKPNLEEIYKNNCNNDSLISFIQECITCPELKVITKQQSLGDKIIQFEKNMDMTQIDKLLDALYKNTMCN